MKWYLGKIQKHIPAIEELFANNANHKHAENYSKWPLFEYTKFSRMGYDDNKMVYYSAGIARPEYGNSIRIMSRHTRDRDYNFGSYKDDLDRGLKTLDYSAFYAIELGYKDIWVSREESPKLLEYFAKNSKLNWSVTYEDIPLGRKQYVLRLK